MRVGDKELVTRAIHQPKAESTVSSRAEHTQGAFARAKSVCGPRPSGGIAPILYARYPSLGPQKPQIRFPLPPALLLVILFFFMGRKSEGVCGCDLPYES